MDSPDAGAGDDPSGAPVPKGAADPVSAGIVAPEVGVDLVGAVYPSDGVVPSSGAVADPAERGVTRCLSAKRRNRSSGVG